MTEAKNRHGCLSVWLAFMIVMNAATALFYAIQGDQVRAFLPDAPGWTLPVLIVCSALNVVFTIALFQWKKWGFWAFCASSVLAMAVNLQLGIGVVRSALGLAGALVLFAVLKIGDENEGWSQLD